MELSSGYVCPAITRTHTAAETQQNKPRYRNIHSITKLPNMKLETPFTASVDLEKRVNSLENFHLNGLDSKCSALICIIVDI